MTTLCPLLCQVFARGLIEGGAAGARYLNHWITGSLGHSLSSPLGHWVSGSLGSLTTGSLGHWVSGSVDSLTNCLLCCQVFARGLIERGAPGAIVNISSQASQRCLPNHAVYCTSKAAVDQLTRCLAYELGPHKVRFLHVAHMWKTTYFC